MKTFYQCETCGFMSDAQSLVAACEALPTLDPGVQPGDIVYCRGQGYGWWQGSEEWFLREAGDPESRSRSERARVGYPLYLVVAIVPIATVNTNIPYGQGGHRDVAILYSPAFANSKTGKKIGWTSPDGHFSMIKTGEVSGDDLARLAVEARAYVNGDWSRVGLI